jgi:hypothetical protein
MTAAFRKSLSEAGYVDGQNVTNRVSLGGGGHLDRLPELAADLVRREVSLIFAGGGPAKEYKNRRQFFKSRVGSRQFMLTFLICRIGLFFYDGRSACRPVHSRRRLHVRNPNIRPAPY